MHTGRHAISHFQGARLYECVAPGGLIWGEETNSQMKLKFIAFLTLLFCYPLVFAEPLASASYQDVCEQMDQQGISSRTQLDPSSQQLVDNVVVVLGAGQTSRRKQTQSVANSDIVVGASMIQANTVNSNSNQTSNTVAQSADPCR